MSRDEGLDVVGIGNALVDVLSHVEDELLDERQVAKGIMHLIDHEKASSLYERLGARTEASGGSAANTVAGVAMLGGRAGYIGKVCNDQLGDIFAKDLSELGVEYSTPRAAAGPEFATGRSIVLISPDGERTMNTYLGAAEFLSPDDIDIDMVSDTRWLFLEGYRFDGPDSVQAFRKAVKHCHAAGGSVAVTLSDPFCVERNRLEFRELVADGVELLVCNYAELTALYETDDVNRAMDAAVREVETVACTLSEKGAVIGQARKRFQIDAYQTDVVDVTGAGDLFAAGLLYGLVSGSGPRAAGMMGCLAASEVVSHIGARPHADLQLLLQERGLSPAQFA